MITSRRLLSLFFALAFLFFFGCDGGGTTPGGNTYDIGSSAAGSGISSARVFVPSGSGQTGAATVSGGFTNNKEQFYWLAQRLQSGGIIAMAISASNNSSISGYERAHRDGMNLLASENTNSRSAINGRVGKRGIMGFSMGGGAVINLGSLAGVSAVVAMAPYSPDTPSRNHTAATMIFTGTSDMTAPARMGEGAYNNLPSTTPRLYASLSGKSHMYWMNNSRPGSEADFIVAWAQYYLNDDQAAYSVFSRGAGSGMTNYKFNPGSGDGGGGTDPGGCN
jgi:dienelactone hydrolase